MLAFGVDRVGHRLALFRHRRALGNEKLFGSRDFRALHSRVLSRLVTTTIVLFWVVMTVLLVRSELWPDRSSLRTVPVEKVLKLMWFHHEPSELVVWSESRPVGHLRLHPKIRESDGARLLEYSGNVQVRLPGSPRQRISWDGVAEFDAALTMRSMLIGLDMRDITLDRAEITIVPSENRAFFKLKDVSERVLNASDYSLDERGLKKLLAQVDLDPALYDTFRSSTPAKPTITAQESSILIHHERMKTYLIEMRQGGQTLLEAHVNELGRIVRVKTLVGYSLAPDDLTP